MIATTSPMPYAGPIAPSASVSGGALPTGSLPVPARRDTPAAQLTRARRAAVAVAILAGLSALVPVATWLVGEYALTLSADAMRIYSLASMGGAALFGLGTGIALLIWVYRAHRALHSHKAQTSLSAGLAVGGFFIPFANLVLPFLAIRDAVRVGKGSLELAVVLWWPLWMAYAALHLVHSLAMSVLQNPDVTAVVPARIVGHATSIASWSWIADMAGAGAAFGVLALVAALAARKR